VKPEESMIILTDSPKKTAASADSVKTRISNLVKIDILQYAKDWKQVMQGLTPKTASGYMTDLKEGYLTDAMRMFDEMERRDPDIKADMGLRKNSIAHRKIMVHPADDSGEAKKQAEWLEEALKTPALLRLPQLMTDAIPKGFALIQLTYKYDGKFLIPDTIQRIPAWGLLMRDADKIVEFPLLAGDYGLAGTPIEESEQLIFHKHFEQDFTFLSSGLMYTLVLAYVLRNYNLKDWAAFIERHGNPLVIGHYASGANATEKEYIRQAVQELMNDLAAVLDENTKIEIIETKASGATPYERMLQATKDFISKVALGQTLSTNESQYGTKAQATVQAEVRTDLLKYDAFSFELTLNEQLVRNLIGLNFSNPLFPHIQIDVRGDATKEDIQAGYEMGLDISKKQVRSVLNLSEPADEGDTLLKPEGAQSPFQNGQQMNFSEVKKNSETLMLKEKIEIKFDDILQGGIDKAAEGYARLENEMIRQVEASGYEYALEHIWDSYAEMNSDLGAILADAASAAEIIGVGEAKREAAGEEIVLSDSTFSDNPINPDEGLKLLKRKPVVSSRQDKALNAKWKGRMFSVAGYDNLKTIGKAHDFLVQAYDEGLSFEDFRIRTNAVFRNEGLAAPDRFHLRTVFETNMQSAYMAGRVRQMLENVDERPYWRILTAGDDRVRPAHRALHGKIFHYQEILDRGLIPPFDYNCRCTIQALTPGQIQQMGLKVEEKALAIYDDPETGLPVNIRPREGFGHNPDDYNFGIVEYKEEVIPEIERIEGSSNWKERNRPDADLKNNKEKTPEDFIDAKHLIRINPESKLSEIGNLIAKEISKEYPSLLSGWPDKLEMHIPLPFKDTLLFNQGSLNKLLKYPERIIDFNKFIDTVQNPWEVWVNKNPVSGEWGYTFIKMYNDKKENLYCRVDIYPSEGAKVTTYFVSRNKSYLNNRRNGIALIYVNDDLLEK